MSLKHALLGFLDYGPMTGYELNQCLEQSVQHFWHANLSQIYPSLNEMEQQGLLTSEVQFQGARPNRKVYHITADGHTELLRWLGEPMALPAHRVPFLVQVFFGSRLRRDEMIVLLRRQLAQHRELLDLYQGPVREQMQLSADSAHLPEEVPFWELTLEAGVKIEQAWIDWCEQAVDRIEGLGGTARPTQEG